MRNFITWFHELKKEVCMYVCMYVSITVCSHVSMHVNIIFCLMMDHPTIDEIHKTIKEINTGKAPGLNGIPVEVFPWGSDKITAKSHRLISDVLLGAPVH